MIPFTDNSAHITDDFCTERRLTETLAFIKPGDFMNGWLDIGPSNHAADSIAEYWWQPYSSTEGDLNDTDWFIPNNQRYEYGIVTCLEVIEHVMNPLQLLELVRHWVAPNGVLYLSTPVHNPYGFYFNETNHFTEYKESSLRTLVEYAGFRITDYHQFRSIPFWKGMKQGGGLFRTALRVSSQRTQILRAVKV